MRAERLGLDGDQVSDVKHHGGPDQAVYAFAREDLDWWEGELGREIRDGQFGENLTTSGLDVNEAEVGERWQVGTALFEVSSVRIPCNDFKNWQRVNGFDDRAWVKRFAQQARPGPTCGCSSPASSTAGDELRVVHQPGHGVTVSMMFRALTTEHALLPELLKVENLVRRGPAQGRGVRRPPHPLTRAAPRVSLVEQGARARRRSQSQVQAVTCRGAGATT